MTNEEMVKRSLERGLIPLHMHKAVIAWVCNGETPGTFLRAALRDELVGSHLAADDLNLASMNAWARWLYTECPSRARGDKETIEAWRVGGGANGLGYTL